MTKKSPYKNIIKRRIENLAKKRKNRDKKLAQYRARVVQFERRFILPSREYVDFQAPSVFSIISNRSETILYLKNIDASIADGIFTSMNLSKSKTDLPTICLLSAYMWDYRTPGKYLQVVIPSVNDTNRVIWDEVQFERMIIRKQLINFKTGKFLSRISKSVNEEAISETLDSTIKFFGEDQRQKLVNLSTVIVEIVENTAFHAIPEKENKLPWLLNTRQSTTPDGLEMEFCIVDLGVGIYDSIKENVNKWNTSGAKIKHILSSALYSTTQQSKFLSNNIPKGIGSSTNKKNRGRGVKHIQKMALDPIYSYFDIITNKAQVHLKDLDNIELDSTDSLYATIYNWKIRI